MENIKRLLPGSTTRNTDQLAKRLVLGQLQRLENGLLRITENGDTTELGQPAADGLEADLIVHDPSVWRDLVTGGSIGAAEAYVAGDWDSPDLVALLRFFARNIDRMNEFEDRFAWLSKPALKGLHWLNRNSESGSRKNIQAHYDLGNELFERFLDPTMMYSSAIFPSQDATLEEASRYKLDRICQKLDLQPQDQVIEIGTGWGGFALHAAREYGCHVTTTTISKEQYAWVQQRIQEQGLEDRIELLFLDYRALEGQFDKLVSIEMIEAVGPQYLDSYLRQIGQLLKPDGLALIQAITIPEQRYRRALKNVDFIQRYIFPGSFIPSVGAIMGAVEARTDLVLSHVEDIGFQYARTLRCWRENFEAESDSIRALGYDEAFQRLWRYYFAYCEAGFAERRIGDAQILFARPENRRPNLVAAGSLTSTSDNHDEARHA